MYSATVVNPAIVELPRKAMEWVGVERRRADLKCSLSVNSKQ